MAQHKGDLKTPKNRSSKAHMPPPGNARPTGSTQQNGGSRDVGEFTDRGRPALENN